MRSEVEARDLEPRDVEPRDVEPRGTVARDYLAAVCNRAHDPLPPVAWKADWSDKPRSEKHWPGQPATALPAHRGYPADASLDAGLYGQLPTRPLAFDESLLCDMLHDSYGLHARRLHITANDDQPLITDYVNGVWARGAASGGGLYPLTVHWFRGTGSVPGIYAYSPRRNSFDRLAVGDPTAHLHRAGLSGTTSGGNALVLSVRFWANAFKYAAFGYHVMTMDVGTVIQTWRMWAGARGLRIRPALLFDEPALAGALGVDPLEEGVLAVVPLHWSGDDRPPPVTRQSSTTVRAPTEPRVRAVAAEKSKQVHTFALLETVQGAVAAERCRVAALAPPPPATDGPRVPLPDPPPMPVDVRTALRARRSSFGTLRAAPPMSAAALAGLLRATHAGCAVDSDAAPDGLDDAMQVYAVVQHVDGVERGCYRYRGDPEGGGAGELVRLPHDIDRSLLQRRYFLPNYSLEQAGVVLIVAVRGAEVFDAFGEHGLRLINLAAGAATQAAYTAAAAIGVGIGAALGFDNTDYAAALDLTDRDIAPLIILLAGSEHAGSAGYEFGLT